MRGSARSPPTRGDKSRLCLDFNDEAICLRTIDSPNRNNPKPIRFDAGFLMNHKKTGIKHLTRPPSPPTPTREIGPTHYGESTPLLGEITLILIETTLTQKIGVIDLLIHVVAKFAHPKIEDPGLIGVFL